MTHGRALPYRRAERVAEQMMRELSQMLLMEMRDPRLTGVSITHVDLTDDLRSARIYYSLMGDAAAREAARAGFTKATGFLRHEVTERLRLRIAPEMQFKFDPSLETAQRIDELLADAGVLTRRAPAKKKGE